MEASLFGLEGKSFIVLGGGQGMGEATCNLLADLGANVAVLDIIGERAERVAADIVKKKNNVRSLAITADVLDDDALVAAIARAEKEIGPLDGMASIVGMAYMGSAIDIPMDLYDLDHQRNLRYIFLAAREVARNLIARGAPGSIVSVASVDGIQASTGHTSYGSAKAGLVHQAKSLAGEWSRYGIRVNVVAPGAMITPRVRPGTEEKERELMKLVPMQKRGGVNDIAKALVFFLSDLSAYVTGQTLPVDGGYTAVGPIDYSGFGAIKGVTGVAPK